MVLFVAVIAVATLAAAGLSTSSSTAGLGPGVGRVDARATSGTVAMTTPRAGGPADAPAVAGVLPLPTAWNALPAGTPPADLASAAPCAPGPDAICRPVPEPTPLPTIAAAGMTLHVPILEYHRIKPPAGETGSARSLIVPPELFAAQMDAMSSAGWHTITMGQLGDDLRLGMQPSPRSFVVTFDDGYEDGYTYAAPVLGRDGFVATYFVVAGRIDTPDHLTVDELRALQAAGNEIGNHTVSHSNLEAMDPARLTSEIFGASRIIASDVGVWPQSFAYPAGLTDALVQSVVAATPGVETAVIQSGSLPQTWNNRMLLCRVRVGPGTYPQDLVARADRYQP
jgi:peptidoglycan/xylan/chitin deacetylase (PgdA/CDA1 family)